MNSVRLLLVLALVAAAIGASGCKAKRGNETVDCTPGAEIWVGCNQQCELGQCSGDPWMQICDGDTPVDACDDDTLIAESDDSSAICFSTCPLVQMVCPASGHVTVTLRGYTGRTTGWTCDWRLEERAPLSLGDAGRRDAGLDAGGGP